MIAVLLDRLFYVFHLFRRHQLGHVDFAKRNIVGQMSFNGGSTEIPLFGNLSDKDSSFVKVVTLSFCAVPFFSALAWRTFRFLWYIFECNPFASHQALTSARNCFAYFASFTSPKPDILAMSSMLCGKK